jgi:lipid-A-disaccharide synthase
MGKIFISVLDSSAELYISRVSFFIDKKAVIYSTSPRIKRSEKVLDITDLSTVGLPDFRKVFLRVIFLLRFIVEVKPDKFVFCDSPDLHIPIGMIMKSLFGQRVKSIYFIPPAVWAWRKHRKDIVEKFFDRVIFIFPFEKDIWTKNGVYVGHPLCKIIKEENSYFDYETQFRSSDLSSHKGVICFLPGSRYSEVKNHIHILRSLGREMRDYVFLVPTRFSELIEMCRGEFSLKVVPQELSRFAMRICDFVISASGTATLESALLGKPTVVFYKLPHHSFELAKRMIEKDLRFISLPNIILGEEVFPELIQDDATAEKIIKALNFVKEKNFGSVSKKLFDKLDFLDFPDIAKIIDEL